MLKDLTQNEQVSSDKTGEIKTAESAEEGLTIDEAMKEFNQFSDWVIANHKTKSERDSDANS